MKFYPKTKFENEEFEKDIDLKNFLGVFMRNKIFIFSFSALFFILSCLYAIIKKRVWEGDFQIVLKLEKNDNSGIYRSGLSALSGLTGVDIGGNMDSSLKTEVGILQSTSILMPIYEFVKNEREKKYPGKDFDSFRDWKKDYLDITLEKGTSILDISYRDTEKELIIPILNKMTEVYQSHSGKANRRNLELTKSFLKNQISEYRIKIDESIKVAQDYAIDQDLSIVDLVLQEESNFNNPYSFNLESLGISGAIPNLGGSGKTNLESTVNVEVARVKAANKIKNIELTLEKIINISDENKNTAFLSYLVPELSRDDTFKNLKKLDLKIYDLNSRFKENYEPLIRAKQMRENMIDQIKDTAIAFLNAKKINAEATYQSAIRPKEVLLKYKQLVRESKRDEITLIQLEDLYTSIQLQEAKIEDPWELITKPRLKEKSVAPRRKNIALLGGILGTIIGYLVSIIKEQKSKIIYSSENLELLLASKVLKIFNISNTDYLSDIKEFFKEMTSLSNKKELKILVSNNFYKSKSNAISDLSKATDIEIIFLNQISNIKNSNVVLLTSIGSIYRDEINEINQRLEIIDKELLGIVLLDI